MSLSINKTIQRIYVTKCYAMGEDIIAGVHSTEEGARLLDQQLTADGFKPQTYECIPLDCVDVPYVKHVWVMKVDFDEWDGEVSIRVMPVPVLPSQALYEPEWSHRGFRMFFMAGESEHDALAVAFQLYREQRTQMESLTAEVRTRERTRTEERKRAERTEAKADLLPAPETVENTFRSAGEVEF